MAGDRFILLNSVAVVTVVFCCDNGCEYKIGVNFVILIFQLFSRDLKNIK